MSDEQLTAHNEELGQTTAQVANKDANAHECALDKAEQGQKLSLSVAIIAHNEEDRLPLTLATIQDIASEIILINSESTDNTVAVAQSFGAKVYTEAFKGYVEQKNSLIPKCTQDWILFLDADEVLNDELKADICRVIKENQHYSYEMNRLTFYLGKLLKHAWQPNYRLRLVRRDASPRWVGEIVHESLENTCETRRLNGYIIHYSYRDVADHFNRTIRYAQMSAQSYINKGKKSSLLKIIFSPFFSFFKLYVVKLGFLDGKAGYVAAQSAFIYTFLKYIFLWEAQAQVSKAMPLPEGFNLEAIKKASLDDKEVAALAHDKQDEQHASTADSLSDKQDKTQS